MLNKFRKGIKAHSSELFTGCAIGSLIITVCLVADAAIKTDYILDDAADDIENTDDAEEIKQIKKETAKAVCKTCGGAAVSAGFTVYCIVKANTSANDRTDRLVASAVGAGEALLLDYKNTAKNVLTKKQYDDVQTEYAKRQMERTDVITTIGDGDDLCIESITGRPMYGDINVILSQWNDLMSEFPDNGELTLGDWLYELGLGNEAKLGEMHKWIYDTGRGLRTVHIIKRAIIYNGKPCFVIDYDRYPVDKEMR